MNRQRGQPAFNAGRMDGEAADLIRLEYKERVGRCFSIRQAWTDTREKHRTRAQDTKQKTRADGHASFVDPPRWDGYRGLLLVFDGCLSGGEACDRYAERFDIVSDWKEVRHYIPIKGECIESIYFGVNITEGKKERIVNYARTKLNPNIKLYQRIREETPSLPPRDRVGEVVLFDARCHRAEGT